MNWGDLQLGAERRKGLYPFRRILTCMRALSASLGPDYPRMLGYHAVRASVAVGLFCLLVGMGVRLFPDRDRELLLLLLPLLAGWACLSLPGFLGAIPPNDLLRNRLRRSGLHLIHRLSLESLEPMSRGEWIYRCIGDLERLERFLLLKVPEQIGALALGVTSFGIVTIGTGGLGLSLAIPALALFGIAFRLEKIVRVERLVVETLRKELDDIWEEGLSGLRTIHVHQAEAFFQRRYDDSAMRQSKVLRQKRRARLLSAFESVPLIGLSIVPIFIFGTTGESSLSLLLALPLFQSAWLLGRGAVEWQEIESNLTSFTKQLGPDLSGSQWGRVTPNSNESVDELSLEAAFWETSEDWAGPLNWTARRGEFWVITGPSDSGKSSLLEVFAGLRALSEGKVVLHTALGATAFNRPPVGLCSYVEQHPFIFKGTLRENLLFGHESRLSDAILWRTLERVGLLDWVKELGGLDAEFSAQGRELLKAEKYRIALGRALLLNRPFLLLDEPFVHFDDMTIRSLSTLLDEEKRRRGIIAVSRFVPKDLRLDGVISVTEFETKRAESWGSVTRLRTANPTPL